jgi:hypothetical protein
LGVANYWVAQAVRGEGGEDVRDEGWSAASQEEEHRQLGKMVGGWGIKKKKKKVSSDDVLTCSAMDVHGVALFSLLVSSLCMLYRPLHEGV